MSFESISIPEKEKKIPEITSEEWIKYSGGNKNDEEFKAWMEEKGIKFDNNGNVKVELDGEIVRTTEDDFGTIIEEPDAIVEKASA